MKAKVCKQCGEMRPIEMFRPYYGGRKGTYNTCKFCEKINSRAKYLQRKLDKCSAEELEELNKIYALWDMQRQAGLNPPKRRKETQEVLSKTLDEMLKKYSNKVEQIQEAVQATGADNVPAELGKWLTEPLTEDPDYYLDTVYEQLKAKFRPQIRIDTATLTPVYDDTYKPVLDKVLERFYDYEDSYYKGD